MHLLMEFFVLNRLWKNATEEIVETIDNVAVFIAGFSHYDNHKGENFSVDRSR